MFWGVELAPLLLYKIQSLPLIVIYLNFIHFSVEHYPVPEDNSQCESVAGIIKIQYIIVSTESQKPALKG
jgi:hypothetical protein